MPPDPGFDSWHLPSCDLEQLRRVAEIIALDLKAGDCVRLVGDLGAGKTTFATFLLCAYADDDMLNVPSPTFTLVERYDLERGVIHHADLYRLEDPDEADELGLEDAISEGIVLIEWPERAEHVAGASYLSVELRAGANEGEREVLVYGTADWQHRLTRLVQMAEFAQLHVSGDDRLIYLQGDASARRYAVVRGGAGARILMDSPPQPDGPVVEDGKSYSAIAHLAETVTPFVAVDAALDAAGLCVPDVLASDMESGFLLISHLGDRVFGAEIAAGGNIHDLYLQAAYVLLRLREHQVPEEIRRSDGVSYMVPRFDWPAFRIETRLFTDWYLPAVSGRSTDDEQCSALDAVWKSLFEMVDGHNHWMIRDYHSPNLIYRPHETGVGRVGVIDFQDALRGHAAYDLVSLLQDARLDVPEDIEIEMLQRYCDSARDTGPFDVGAFCTAYAILGAQRATKILGIFARLAQRDGKPQYLAHIPRIWGYLERNLRHDTLKPLQTWYTEAVPEAWRHLS